MTVSNATRPESFCDHSPLTTHHSPLTTLLVTLVPIAWSLGKEVTDGLKVRFLSVMTGPMLGKPRSLRDILSARSFRRVFEGVCWRARRRELHGPRRIRAGLRRRHHSRVRGKVRIPRRDWGRRRRRRAYLTLKVEPHVADFHEGIVPRLSLSGHAEPNQTQQANPPAAGNRPDHLNPFTVARHGAKTTSR
jgi:hypothetical protein